jgi:hypothetical protein
MITIRVLTGHTSPETAYECPDYPYGFRLRCKIRYWIEYRPGYGCRFVSQTSNPKRPGLVWNKPKASTYSRFGAALYLDENEHVQSTGLSEYCTAEQASAWLTTYGEGVPPAAQPILRKWVAAKVAYDAARTPDTDDLVTGVKEAFTAFIRA